MNQQKMYTNITRQWLNYNQKTNKLIVHKNGDMFKYKGKSFLIDNHDVVLDFKKGRKPKKNSMSYEIGIPYLVKGVIDGNELPELTIDERIIHINDLDLFMLMDGANSGNIYFGFEGALGSTFSKLEIKNELLREIIYQFILLNLDNIKNQKCSYWNCKYTE